MVKIEQDKLVITVETGGDALEYYRNLQQILLQLYKNQDWNAGVPVNHWMVPDFLMHLAEGVQVQQLVTVEM